MTQPRQNKESLSDRESRTGPRTVRALGLTSGGLDSILSALILKEQGIQVMWLNFETPFFDSGKARRAARMTGIALRVMNISRTFIQMLKDPHCGYGANMNPCLDCHALMLKIAGSVMREEGFDFLFTGEVVGQRPMSQTKPSLRYVEKNSGFAGYILRPLSAGLLPPTVPEEKGLVDRERLLTLSGRSRKPQAALAAAFGIADYPAPAGGCLLTDPGFSRRVRDLLKHRSEPEERDFELLKHGRHFRFHDRHKVVVGRTQEDNRRISRLIDSTTDIELSMMDMAGPTVVIPYGAPEEIVREAARLCAAYSKTKEGQPARIRVKRPGGSRILTVEGRTPETYHAHLL